jgi:hypothetical protein
MDKDRVKWEREYHADFAAKWECDAINDWGFIHPKYWTKL